jgi:prophage tail gpP-like protein
VSGIKAVETKPAEVVVEISGAKVDEREVVPGTKRVVYGTLKAKLGTRRYDFLKTQLDRAGLFLWAANDGGFIIARPTAKQQPVATLVRQRGSGARQPGTILRHTYRNSIVRRFTSCVVYGHGGGRNFGRSKNRGEFVDEEMVKLMGGDTRPLVIHDDDAKTVSNAEKLAQRKIMVANRDQWELTYVVAGHSIPGSQGSAVWAPDTVVNVDDRELGISGTFYVESLSMRRAPDTTTTLRLMKPEHVEFGASEA